MSNRIISLLQNKSRPSLEPIIIFNTRFGAWYPKRSNLKGYLFNSLLAIVILYQTDVFLYMIASNNYHVFLNYIQYSCFLFSAVKMYTYVRHHKKFEALFNFILSLEEETIASGKHSSIVLEYRIYCHYVTYGFRSIGFVVTTVFYINFWLNNLILPLLNGSTDETNYITIFYVWLPFNDEDACGRLVSWILQSVISHITCLYAWIFDPIILASMVFFAGQLKALRCRCAHALDDPREDVCLKNIIKCHEIYIDIRKYIFLMNELISRPMCLNLVLLTLNFGVTIISMVKYNDVSELMTDLALCFALMFQLLLYYWVANEVTVQSESVFHGIYESEWVYASPRVRRAVLMLGAGMRRPIVYTAGPFSEISLAAFVSIVRTSYSFYTLLSQIS